MLFQMQINSIFGQIISNQGVKSDPGKLIALTYIQPPKSIEDI